MSCFTGFIRGIMLGVWLAASLGACSMMRPENEVDSISYSVRRGDTLNRIADRFGANPRSIARENQIRNPNQLEVGQVLRIPLEPGDDIFTFGSKPNDVVEPGSNMLIHFKGASNYYGKLHFPIEGGQIISRFGKRMLSFHEGIDIRAAEGTPIHAALDGKVVFSGRGLSGYGNLIAIESGPILTIYAHNSQNDVERGDVVRKGEIIGQVGMSGNATGPHLHFEVRLHTREKKYAAVSPAPFFKRIEEPSVRASMRSSAVPADSY